MSQRLSQPKYLHLGVLAVVWAAVNALLWLKLDIQVVADSRQYMLHADRLLAERAWWGFHYQWYLSYIAVLAGIKVFDDSLLLVVMLQVLLSGLATVSIYAVARYLSKEPLSGLIGALCFLLFFEISQWNFYILCESLLVSATAIVFFLTVRWYFTGKGLFLLLAVLLFSFFIKPTSIWLVLVSMAVIFHKWHPFRAGIHARLFLVPVAIVLLLLLNKMLQTFLLIDTYADGEIIYGTTTMDTHPLEPGMTTSVPADLFIPSTEMPPLLRVLSFMFNNPVFFTKLVVLKLLAFTIHIKSYYSISHNLVIGTGLVFIYFFAGRAWRALGSTAIRWMIAAYVLLHAFTVAFTVEDWDGRFLMPVLPPLCMLAGLGAAPLLRFKMKS